MKRRDFVKWGAGAVITGGLAACQDATSTQTVEAAPAIASAQYRWKMVTTWPTNFPGLGTGANNLAQLINTMSGGRITVKVYGATELVPAFEVFDAVAQGTAEMGHGAAYYWKGKSEAFQFFSTVPFGLNAQEMNGWLYYGGGLPLWEEMYAPYGVVPAAAGNTGVQMGGWFNKKIEQLSDLQGLKMRIPGLGGEVLKRAGGVPVNLPGGELFTALQSGVLDATEWVGPYNDLAFGFNKVAQYYYYPGWHEPGTTLECVINKKALQRLPADLQAIVLNACKVVNQDMLAQYTANNNAALETLSKDSKITILRFPDDVLNRLKQLSETVVAEIAAKDPKAKQVYESYQQFRQQAMAWHHVSEQAYFNVRAG